MPSLLQPQMEAGRGHESGGGRKGPGPPPTARVARARGAPCLITITDNPSRARDCLSERRNAPSTETTLFGAKWCMGG